MRTVRRVFLVLAGCAVLIYGYRLWQENREFRASLQKARVQAAKEHRHAENLRKIKSLAVSAAARPTETIRSVMHFVHDHSVHPEGGEPEEYAFDMGDLVESLLFAAEGKGRKPRLSCGPRSYAMKEILLHCGIRSRLIQIFSDDFDPVKPHRMLEVLNPETNAWEVWDPDFRVTYVDRGTGRRLDIVTIIFGRAVTVAPLDEGRMDWDLTRTRHLKEHYFEAVLFEGINQGMSYRVLMINREKFDPDRRFADGRTFREWAEAQYPYPRLVVLPLDR